MLLNQKMLISLKNWNLDRLAEFHAFLMAKTTWTKKKLQTLTTLKIGGTRELLDLSRKM
jgi:hypothetical protein